MGRTFFTQYGKLGPLSRLSPTSASKTAMEFHVELIYSEVMQQKDPSIRSPKIILVLSQISTVFSTLSNLSQEWVTFFNYYFCFFPHMVKIHLSIVKQNTFILFFHEDIRSLNPELLILVTEQTVMLPTKIKVKVAQSCLTLCNPMDCSPWNCPGQNTGKKPFLFPGDLLTQGLNPGLLHCRPILYQLSCWGSPRILKWGAYPFCSRFS